MTDLSLKHRKGLYFEERMILGSKNTSKSSVTIEAWTVSGTEDKDPSEDGAQWLHPQINWPRKNCKKISTKNFSQTFWFAFAVGDSAMMRMRFPQQNVLLVPLLTSILRWKPRFYPTKFATLDRLHWPPNNVPDTFPTNPQSMTLHMTTKLDSNSMDILVDTTEISYPKLTVDVAEYVLISMATPNTTQSDQNFTWDFPRNSKFVIDEKLK